MKALFSFLTKTPQTRVSFIAVNSLKLDESGNLFCALVAGVNDHLLCGRGWHERALDGRFGFLYRPTGREAEFALNLPAGTGAITALICASATLCGVLRGELFCEKKSLGEFALDSENWVLRRFPLPPAPAGLRRFCWIIKNPFIPNDYLRNGDFREMGVHVASVRFDSSKKEK